MSFWLTVAGHGRGHVRLALRRARAADRAAGLLGAIPPLRPDRRLRLARHARTSRATGASGGSASPPPRLPRSRPGARVSSGSRSPSGWRCSGCCESRSELVPRPRSAEVSRLRGASASLAADRRELGRARARPPSRSANDRSSPPARKIHASASGSRSAGIARRLVPAASGLGDEVVNLADVSANDSAGSRRPRRPR